MSKKLHQEKCLFEVGLKQLKKLKLKETTEEFTEEDNHVMGFLIENLWNVVYLYGLSLAHSMLSTYPMGPNDYQEVQSELYIAFTENLYNYEPNYTYTDKNGVTKVTEIAPTTYFKPHFRGAIRKYILNKFHNVKQYDANNIRKVKKAIQYYESLGVNYTPLLLSKRTKLSVKVVEQTMEVIVRSQSVNLDDLYDVKGTQQSPEHTYLEKCQFNETLEIIKSKLSPEDLELFLCWANPEERTMRSFETVSGIMNMDSVDVRQNLNRITLALASDPDLKSLSGPGKRKKRKFFDTNLHIQEEAIDPLPMRMHLS